MNVASLRFLDGSACVNTNRGTLVESLMSRDNLLSVSSLGRLAPFSFTSLNTLVACRFGLGVKSFPSDAPSAGRSKGSVHIRQKIKFAGAIPGGRVMKHLHSRSTCRSWSFRFSLMCWGAAWIAIFDKLSLKVGWNSRGCCLVTQRRGVVVRKRHRCGLLAVMHGASRDVTTNRSSLQARCLMLLSCHAGTRESEICRDGLNLIALG